MRWCTLGTPPHESNYIINYIYTYPIISYVLISLSLLTSWILYPALSIVVYNIVGSTIVLPPILYTTSFSQKLTHLKKNILYFFWYNNYL